MAHYGNKINYDVTTGVGSLIHESVSHASQGRELITRARLALLQMDSDPAVSATNIQAYFGYATEAEAQALYTAVNNFHDDQATNNNVFQQLDEGLIV